MKTDKGKLKLIEQIKKTPILQVACQKTGIGRATYYRWRGNDEKFREEADRALEEGTQLINEMAESQLISAIRDQNLTAIIFWLKNRHKAFKTRVELSGQVKTVNEVLNEEQKELIKQALKLSNLLPESNSTTDSANTLNPNQND